MASRAFILATGTIDCPFLSLVASVSVSPFSQLKSWCSPLVALCLLPLLASAIITFTQTLYAANIPITASVNTEVVRISITSSASVSYVLLPTTGPGSVSQISTATPFAINPTTGSIYVAAQLTSFSTYQFMVIARELINSNQISTASAIVSITVIPCTSNLRALDFLLCRLIHFD
jgi:hypothetical protein